MVVSIQVPAKSFFDEDINLTVTGLEQGQNVTLTVRISRMGVTMTSFAKFVADEEGRIDVSKQPALPGGTYEGIETMGLFWSLAFTGELRAPMRMMSGGDISSVQFQIKVHDGHHNTIDDVDLAIINKKALAKTTIDRVCAADDIRREEVKFGRMRGMLFLPQGDGPFPAVIDLVGGSHGLVAFHGGLFARRGFACLCVAFAGYDDLPADLEKVEIDYFNECYEFLSTHPSVKKDGIGVFGDCHGGSVALALARCQPGIAAVVAAAPQVIACRTDFYLREAGLNGNSEVFKVPAVVWKKELMELTKSGACDLRAMVKGSCDDWRVHSLEYGKIKAPVLIFCGSDDRCFEADWAVNILNEQFIKESKTNAEIVVVNGVGHGIRPPYFPLTPQVFFNNLGVEVLYGGTSALHAKGQVEIWERTMRFFRQHLGFN